MGDGLSGVVVCRTGEDECMEDNGVFSDVAFECRRGPPASSFYQLWLCPRFSHGGCATGSEGLASDLAREVMAEALDKP